MDIRIKQKWLSIRGLNTYGKANELRERVSDHMKEDDEILVEKIHQLKVDDIVRMLVLV